MRHIFRLLPNHIENMWEYKDISFSSSAIYIFDRAYHLNQKFLYHVHSLLYDAFLQDAEKHSRSREALALGCGSRYYYNIKVTVKICFVETIAFSDQSGESVANHTVPYFFAY